MSITITGIIVAVLARMAQAAGVDVNIDEAALQTIVHAFLVLSQIVGVIIAWIGRVRKGDIDWLGRRKILPPQ